MLFQFISRSIISKYLVEVAPPIAMALKGAPLSELPLRYRVRGANQKYPVRGAAPT